MIEIDFKSQSAFDAYNKKHKMRKSTKVNIGGKDTTAGDAAGKKSASDAEYEKFRADAAPAKKKVDQDRKEALDTIKSGKLSADNMQDTFEKIKSYADWMGYEEIEEFEEELEDMIEDQDTEWFIDRAEELLDPDKKEKEMGDYLAQMDYEDEDSPESYYDDGNTKQTKVMKQNDATAKKINPNLSNSKDLVMKGMADDIDEFMNEIPDEGQDFDKADELLNLVRDNEQGMRDDDDDMIDDYKKGILKVLTTPGKSKNESIKTEGISKYKRALSKGKKTTVKEIKQWMKTLEENRYKKTSNSAARRVSWFVNNNLSEDYESMPISMRKKWSKAAYGRERYLAKEFLKSKQRKVNENLIRGIIRQIIKEKLNEKSFGDTRKIKFNKKDGKKITSLVASKKWKLTTPLYKSKGSEIELHIPKKEYNKAIEFFMINKINPRG